MEFEIKNTVTLISPKMKCLCINLTKYIQYLYKENFKILMNENKEELHKWKDTMVMGGKTRY